MLGIRRATKTSNGQMHCGQMVELLDISPDLEGAWLQGMFTC